jgi:hypothetical protein
MLDCPAALALNRYGYTLQWVLAPVPGTPLRITILAPTPSSGLRMNEDAGELASYTSTNASRHGWRW